MSFVRNLGSACRLVSAAIKAAPIKAEQFIGDSGGHAQDSTADSPPFTDLTDSPDFSSFIGS